MRAAAVLLVVCALAGCTSSSPGYEVNLKLTDAEAFFGAGTLVHLRVEAKTMSYARAGIGLPQGVVLVDGDPVVDGPVAKGEVVERDIHVRATQPGTYVLTGWVSSMGLCTGGEVRTQNLEVTGTATSASIRAIELLAPPVQLDAHLASDDGTIAVTTDSPRPLAAQACLSFQGPEDGTLNTVGPGTWQGTIPAGHSDVAAFKVAAPKDGRYQLQVGVRFDPALGMDTLNQWIWVEAEGSKFTQVNGP